MGIAGGIVIGTTRPRNIYVGSVLVLDMFYKNASSYQSIFTHWGQMTIVTWGSENSWIWRQELYVQSKP